MRHAFCSIVFGAVLSGFLCGCGGQADTTLKQDPKQSAKNEADYKQKMEEAMKNKAAPTKQKYGGPH